MADGEGPGSAGGPGSHGTADEASDWSRDVETLLRRVAAAVRRTCPRNLAQHADDIVQSVVLRLGRPREGNRSFSSTYLRKAAYGVAVDELRRLCRRNEDPVGDSAVLDEIASSAPSPERAAASAETARGIQECLSGLVRPRQLAVILYLQGCTVPEAARQMGWAPKKAENLVYRGLADLRECLRRKGLEP